MAGPRQRLAAIVAADVAGYSRLMAADEAATVAALDSARATFREEIEANQGRVVDTAGDSVLSVFDTAAGAVQAALAIQERLAAESASVPDERRMLFRIGVHLGDIIEKDDGTVYGDGVNVASRIEALAEPGGVAVSGAVHDGIRGRFGLTYDFLGEQPVKNLPEPVRAYRIVSETTAVDAPPALPDKPSIAVLPFANLSGDPEQEYFADGVAEDLITALSRIRWLFVIARNSTFAYKGQSPDVRRVGTELGVRYVLEGSVRKGGNRVRISAQLIDSTTGSHVWAERYDRELEDIFAVQDEITETIAGTIEPEIGMAERERAHRKPPDSLDSWDCYQRGLWNLYHFAKEENVEARRLFDRAIALDPGFAPAFAAAAYAHFMDVALGFGESRGCGLDRALSAARKAVALDDRDAFAHCVLGRIYTFLGELTAAMDELQAAIELNPNLALAHYGLGHAMMATSRPEDAIGEFDTAARLSPHDPFMWFFDGMRSFALILMEDYEDALAWARKASRRHAASAFWPFAFMASALAHLSRGDEAFRAVEEARRRQPAFSLSFVRQTLPFKDHAPFETFFEGLRKAGLDDAA